MDPTVLQEAKMKPEIIINTIEKAHGLLGHIILNRPQALNALSLNILESLRVQLGNWQQDQEVIAVLIEGAGDRAFCSGGDIRGLYQVKDEPASQKDIYFEHEYHLNELIFNYPKPYISLLDGIAMGGGLGVSIWGSHPIATERLILAMPETGIGLFPDVGSSYFLTRLPNYIGWYLGLTGNSINAYEALQLNLVKTVLHHEQLDHFKATLDPSHILLPHSIPLDSHSELLAHQDDIHDCFSQSSITAMLNELDARDQWCQSIAATLRARSPLSLRVTLEYLKQSCHKNFADVMMLNKTLVHHFLRDPEFYEGIRAAVIDKDKQPKWQHRIEEVDAIDVSRFFKAPIS